MNLEKTHKIAGGWGRIGAPSGTRFPCVSPATEKTPNSLAAHATTELASMPHSNALPSIFYATSEAPSPLTRKSITTLCQVHAVPQPCDPGSAPTLKAGSMPLQPNLVPTRRKPIHARSLSVQQALQTAFEPLGCPGHSGPLSSLQPPVPAKLSPFTSHVKSRPTLKHSTP